MTALHQVGRALPVPLRLQGSLDLHLPCPQVSISAISSVTLAAFVKINKLFIKRV